MGSCSSGLEKDLPESWLELFQALLLSPAHVKRLFDMFRKIKMDDSGSVDTTKLLKLLGVERTHFTEQIFTMFDNDGTGKVDFREFVLSLWNYCTISPASLDHYAFNQYDKPGSGSLSSGEVSQMLKDIHGKSHVQDARVKLISTDLYTMGAKATMNLTEFQKYAKTHQALLFPAFNLQHQLQKQILGESFWRRASAHRVELTKGKYVPLSDFLLQYLEKGLYERTVSASNFLRMSSNARAIIQAPGATSNSAPNKSSAQQLEMTITSQSGNPNNDSMENLAHAGHAAPALQPAHSFTGDLFHTLASFTVGGSSASSTGTAGSSGHHNPHQPSNKKGAPEGKHRHGSVMAHTTAAVDSDVHFNNSLKSKPIHASGHHMTDGIRMGCGPSVEKSVPKSWLELFAAMKLSKSEVQRMFNIFRKVDLDGGGSVDIVELLTLLDIERTSFTEQIFTVFDSDGSGKVDFREFVMAVWNYCTIGPASLDIFTFDLYDKDKSGKLSLEEVHQLLVDIYGKSHQHDPKVKAIQQELEKINDKKGITVDVLKTFAKNHQALLYPVFKLQHHLQENVLGTAFWERASQRRIQLSKGKYVTLSDLMLLHMDQGLYSKVLKDAGKMNSKAALVMQSTGTAHGRSNHNKANVAAPLPDHKNLILPGVPAPRAENQGHGLGHAHGHGASGVDLHKHNASGHDLKSLAHPTGAEAGSGDHPHSGEHIYYDAHHHHEAGHAVPHSNKHAHASPHHHHHGAILKNTGGAEEELHHTKKPVHATGHHYSDGRVHAE